MAIKKDWVLTQAGFDNLLGLLDTDSGRAAEKYESIRLHLIKIFESRGGNPSRELADEVINRVVRKLEAGEVIFPETLTNYFFGIARNVLREHLRGPEQHLPAMDAAQVAEPAAEAADKWMAADFASQQDREMDCLEKCLEKFPPEIVQLIVAYYDWPEGNKISSRKRLAARLGITLNSLRIRAHRIRDELEKCAVNCLDESDG